MSQKLNWNEAGFSTRAIHAGQEPDPTSGAVMTPIVLASTYVQESPGQFKMFDYSRAGNPTRKAFEDCLASLEKGDFGFAFSSGCAATTTILHLLSSGDHLIAGDDLYGGSARLFDRVFSQLGIETTYVDMTDLSQLEAAFKTNTKMVWLETPTNPTLKISDIRAVSKMAKNHKALCVVDNTFMSPYFQSPLQLGADIVMHSTTKYIGGHSDILGGAAITSNPAIAEKLKFLSLSMGAVASPFDCYMALRSLKTLALRMEAHQKNALEVARHLESHSKVSRVLYPGLESHPQHELAKSQMMGFGGMMSIYLEGGLEDAKKFLEKVRVFALAESLGGVESLVEHPGIMTHASVPEDRRRKLGISDTLVRMSVGVEDVRDLVQDIENALR